MTQNNYNELYQMFDDLYKGVKKVKNDEYLHQEAEKFKQDKDYLEKNQHLMMMKNIDEENFEEAQKLKTNILNYNEKTNLS